MAATIWKFVQNMMLYSYACTAQKFVKTLILGFNDTFYEARIQYYNIEVHIST